MLDSYKPGREIVSRKHTQIADIKPETWQGYLTEHANKYKPGHVVKDSASMRERYPDLVGRELKGRQYLEIPPQARDVPKWAILAALRLGIRIRDTNGRVYELPSEET